MAVSAGIIWKQAILTVMVFMIWCSHVCVLGDPLSQVNAGLVYVLSGDQSNYIYMPLVVSEQNLYSFPLLPNHPNPFNPITTIPFELSEAAEVSLTVYSVLGERVAVLSDEMFVAGRHEVVWDGTGLSSGVYICRLETGGTVRTQRMLLMK